MGQSFAIVSINNLPFDVVSYSHTQISKMSPEILFMANLRLFRDLGRSRSFWRFSVLAAASLFLSLFAMRTAILSQPPEGLSPCRQILDAKRRCPQVESMRGSGQRLRTWPLCASENMLTFVAILELLLMLERALLRRGRYFLFTLEFNPPYHRLIRDDEIIVQRNIKTCREHISWYGAR